jgi:thioredoxin
MQDWDEELNAIMTRKRLEMKKTTNSKGINQGNTNSIVYPITLTDANFSEAIKKYSLFMVDFWAPWCGPCKVISPIIEQLATELAGKVGFGKLNVDENPRTSNVFGIQSIPTLVIFKSGKVIDGFVGSVAKSQIQSRLAAYIDDR